VTTDFTAERHNDDLFEVGNGGLAHAYLSKCGARITMGLKSHQLVFRVFLRSHIGRVVDRLREVHVRGSHLRLKIAFSKSLNLAEYLLLLLLGLLDSLGGVLGCLVWQLAGILELLFLPLQLSLVDVVAHRHEVLGSSHVIDAFEEIVIATHTLAGDVAIA